MVESTANIVFTKPNVQWKYTYTAHKKFMNGFACNGFDPYIAIISKSRCHKTPVCKPAK